MSALIPFSQTCEADEWEYTTAGRITCEVCNEYIYPRRRVASAGAFAFPPACPVCGCARGGDAT